MNLDVSPFSVPSPVSLVSPFVGVQLLVLVEQSVLAGPSVYLTVMSSSNTPESGAVSKIGPSSGVPVFALVCATTDVPVLICPFEAVSAPAVASVTLSEPLAT